MLKKSLNICLKDCQVLNHIKLIPPPTSQIQIHLNHNKSLIADYIMFGLLISGRLVDTNFREVDATHAVIDVMDADNFNHVVVSSNT